MPDQIESLGRTVIQHGPDSDRIYVLHLDSEELPDVLDQLIALAGKKGYGKIVAKIRKADLAPFTNRDFRPEALIPELFGPGEGGVFVGHYLDEERAEERDLRRIQDVLDATRKRGLEVESAGVGGAVEGGAGPEGAAPSVQEKGDSGPEPGEKAQALPGQELILGEAGPEHAGSLAACYETVFDSYPFPITEPDHLLAEMEKGTRFFGVWEGGSLVAASSMEPGGAPGAVEMTDFATLPSFRGRGLATRLLAIMDREAQEAGHRVAFTIARAVSFGMNLAFAARRYDFGGTLVNNTQIAGSIESMNVWYKIFSRET